MLANTQSGTSWAVRVGVGLLAVTVVAAALAARRWERPAELAPGLPRPDYSRLAETRSNSEQGVCVFDLVVEGRPEDVRTHYDALLLAAGWVVQDTAGDRVNYRRGEQMARVAVRIPTATEPGWVRVRVNLGPCAAARAGDADRPPDGG